MRKDRNKRSGARYRNRKSRNRSGFPSSVKYLFLGSGLIGGFAVVGILLHQSFNGTDFTTLNPDVLYGEVQTEQPAVTTPEPSPNVQPPSVKPSYRVLKVIDGDTFDIEIPNYGYDRIRVKGIDTPEIRKAQCRLEKILATEAKQLAENILLDSFVYLSPDPTRDQYGRTVAIVTLSDQRDYGSLFISKGLAVYFPQERNWCRLGRVRTTTSGNLQ